jgi:hypothetical protein
MIVQCPGALGYESIEASDLGDLIGQHCLTLVRYVRAVKETLRPHLVGCLIISVRPTR